MASSENRQDYHTSASNWDSRINPSPTPRSQKTLLQKWCPNLLKNKRFLRGGTFFGPWDWGRLGVDPPDSSLKESSKKRENGEYDASFLTT
eukprot:6461894-Amphidinium_carterae.1